jgi:hypothetical protein
MLDQRLPREDGERWRASSVRHILKSPAYIGRLERTVGGKPIVVEDAHEAIVSRATWEAANAAKGHGPQHRGEPAILAGIAVCGSCGGPMTRGGGKKRGVQYDAYQCSARCNQPARISLPALDSHVLTLVEQRLAVSEAIDAKRTTADGLRRFEDDLDQAEREEQAYHEAVSAAEIGAAAYGHGARVRAEAVQEAREALAEAASRQQVSGGPSHRDLLGWLGSDEATDGTRNTALRNLLDSVVVERSGRPGKRGNLHERVTVTFQGDDPLEDAAGLGDDRGRERAEVAA